VTTTRETFLSSEHGEPLLGERNGIRCERIVRAGRRPLAVKLDGFRLLAQLFVGLADQALDEGVALVRFQEFIERGLVITTVVRHVALQIWKKLRLLSVGALVEDRLSCSHMALGFSLVPPPSRDAGLCVFPPEIREVQTGRFDIWLFQTQVVTKLVQLVGFAVR